MFIFMLFKLQFARVAPFLGEFTCALQVAFLLKGAHGVGVG